MVYDSLTHFHFLNFVHQLNLRRKRKTIRKPVLLPYLGKAVPNLADPIDRAVVSTKETLCLLKYRLDQFSGTWKLKINESKSSHITFALRQGQCPPVQINKTNIPQNETVKYLDIHFDKRLTWKDHVLTKRKQLEHKTREIKWLVGRYSTLSLENKIIIYKTVLKPVWTYGIELWGCASNSNIEIIK